jgi:hypothetical protein
MNGYGILSNAIMQLGDFKAMAGAESDTSEDFI